MEAQQINQALAEITGQQALTNYLAKLPANSITVEEQQIIQHKYTGIPFGKMQKEDRWSAAKIILLKISVITGWTLPVDTLLDLLIDQFQAKLLEAYKNTTSSEFEYAFRNKGIEIKDWGKQMNLALIDEVMFPYLQRRLEISTMEQNLKTVQHKIEDKRELTDDEWEAWLTQIKNYQFDFIPVLAWDYLNRKGLLTTTPGEKHEYMSRAIASYIAKLNPTTNEFFEFQAMKEKGVFSGDIVDTLIVISKRLIVRDFFNAHDNAALLVTETTKQIEDGK